MKIKHFVINLRRRPERLAFWGGYMFSKGLPVDEVTIMEAVDAKVFTKLGDIFKYATKIGLPHYQPHIDNDKPVVPPSVGLRLSHELLLNHIAGKPSEADYYVIWLDDQVLKVNIEVFEDHIKSFSTDPDIKIVGMKYAAYPERDKENRWERRDEQLHPNISVYKGCIGSQFNECMVLTHEGVKLLSMHLKKHPGPSILFLMFQHPCESIYTSSAHYVRAIPLGDEKGGRGIFDTREPLKLDVVPTTEVEFIR